MDVPVATLSLHKVLPVRQKTRAWTSHPSVCGGASEPAHASAGPASAEQIESVARRKTGIAYCGPRRAIHFGDCLVVGHLLLRDQLLSTAIRLCPKLPVQDGPVPRARQSRLNSHAVAAWLPRPRASSGRPAALP